RNLPTLRGVCMNQRVSQLGESLRPVLPLILRGLGGGRKRRKRSGDRGRNPAHRYQQPQLVHSDKILVPFLAQRQLFFDQVSPSKQYQATVKLTPFDLY